MYCDIPAITYRVKWTSEMGGSVEYFVGCWYMCKESYLYLSHRLHGWPHYWPLFHKHQFWRHEYEYFYYNCLSYHCAVCNFERAHWCEEFLKFRNWVCSPPPASSVMRRQKNTLNTVLLFKTLMPLLLHLTQLRDRSRTAYISGLIPKCRNRPLLQLPRI